MHKHEQIPKKINLNCHGGHPFLCTLYSIKTTPDCVRDSARTHNLSGAISYLLLKYECKCRKRIYYKLLKISRNRQNLSI